MRLSSVVLLAASAVAPCVLLAQHSLPAADAVSDAVGTTPGMFRVDESGQASYRVPIAVTPGVAGMAPDLALVYSSQAGDSTVGSGWMVAGSSQISRCRKTREHGDPLGADNFVGQPVDFSSGDVYCLDGQRLLLVSGTYGAPGSEYRLELDPFTRIRAVGGNNDASVATYTGPQSFRVERRDGTVHLYGGTDNARLAITDCGAGLGRACAGRQWLLSQVEDSSGNFMNYEYARWRDGVAVSATGAADEIHLSEVIYTGKRRLPGQTAAAQSPYARVLFTYGARPALSQHAGWQAGVPYRLSRELTSIGVYEPLTTEVRHYALEHRDAPSGSGRRLLHRIRECSDSSKSVCFPATEFGVEPGGFGLSVATELNFTFVTSGPRLDYRIGDIDGDGRQDIAWVSTHNNCGVSPGVQVLFGSHSGTGISATPNFVTPSSRVACLERSEAELAESWHLLDYNGDGRDDLLFAGANGTQWRLRASLGRPASTTTEVFATTSSLQESLPVGANGSGAQAQLHDLNGDGLLDIVYPQFDADAEPPLVRLAARLGTVKSAPNGTLTRGFGDQKWISFNYASNDPCAGGGLPAGQKRFCRYNFGRSSRGVSGADFDGDGRGDLLLQVTRLVCSVGLPRTEDEQPVSFFETRDGTENVATTTCPQGTLVSSSKAWYMHAAGNVGASVTLRQVGSQEINLTSGAPERPDRVYLADVNGDGLQDFVYVPSNSTTELRLRLNNGLGFAASQVLASGLPDVDSVQLVDVSGDGRADLLYAVGESGSAAQCGGISGVGLQRPLCLRRSLAGSTSSLHALSAGELISEARTTRTGAAQADFDSLFLDMDGDGQLDFVRLSKRVDATQTEARVVRRSARYSNRDALTLITDGFGAQTRVQYQPLTNKGVYRPGKDAWKETAWRGSPVFDLLAPMYVVASVESSAPTRSDSEGRVRTEYRYARARMQSGGRGFLGFAAIDTFDANETAQLGQYGVSRTTYLQTFPYVGAPARTDKAIGSGTPSPAGGVSAACRNHAEGAADCFSPTASDWAATDVGLAPGNAAAGPRLHATTINVYQALEFGVGACLVPESGLATQVVAQTVAEGQFIAAGSRELARGSTEGASVAPVALQPVVFGTEELSYSAGTSAANHTQLSRSFTALCYDDGYGNLTRGYTDVRDPDSSFTQSLHYTITVSEFDNGAPLDSTQPWRLGRLTESTVTKSMPSRPDVPTSERKASFSYDLSSLAKTGQLVSERVEVSGEAATRTLYTLDDYGNRIAAHVCSDIEWDGTPLTDEECRDTSRIRMRPMEDKGQPTVAVHRYTRTEYDSQGRYPVKHYAPFYSPSATNERIERVTEEIVTRNVFGQVTHSRDVNGRNAYARFGVLGRAYASELQGGALTVATLRLCGGAISCPPGAVYRQQTTSSAGPTQWSYHDRLGQPLLLAAQSFAADDPERNFTAVCSFRDSKARPSQTSIPFFLPAQSDAEPLFTGSAADPCSLASNRFEQKSYDLLSRPTTVVAPDGSVLSFSYSGMTVTQTNALGQVSQETRNALGQVVQEVQANPLQPAQAGMAVTHEYDAEGQLRFTRRNAGGGEIVTERSFDAMGRLAESLDPDRGRERFEYNAAGELIRFIDAGGQVVLTHYDAQGRLWRRESGTPLPATPASTIFSNGFESGDNIAQQVDLWQYDTATKGLGSLHFEERQTPQEATYRRTHAYDSLGRPSSVAILIEGQTRSESTTYDGVGRVWQQTDASGGVLEQVYTTRGFVEQIRNGLNVGQIYNRVEEVDARGQVTKERRGNSAAMAITRTYDAQRGWLTGIDTGANGSLQKLRYKFDALGRLEWRDDQRLNQKETFTYDGLNRLRTSSVSLSGGAGLPVLSLSYDALGNICNKNGVAYTYAGRSGCANSGNVESSRPHAVASVGGRAVSYDAQGRVMQRMGATTAQDRYTEFNGLAQLVLALSGNPLSPSVELQLNYTPSGDRYLRRERTGAGLTTTRIYGSVEEVRKPNNTVETRRYLAGVAIEIKQGSAFNSGPAELRYLFTDHLGSLDVIANSSGIAIERLSFDAHGRRRQVTDWSSTLLATPAATTPRGYTGHEHLDSVGLVHMNGRVYDPELGRFLQPDPMLDAGIQGLNRYSYVLNNPLSLTDPTGYLSVGEFLRTAVAVAITVYTGGWAAGVWGPTLTATQAFGVAVAGGFAAGAIQSASLKGGVQGAFTAAAFLGVGSYFESAKWAQHATKAKTLNTVGRVAKIVAHGVTGGVLSDVQGGKFAHGFAAAGFSEAAGPLTRGIESDLGRGIAHALIGGTASQLSGGKFSNGAVTAAMSHAFGVLGRSHELATGSAPGEPSDAAAADVGLSRSYGTRDEAAIAFGEEFGPRGVSERIEYNTAIVKSPPDLVGPPAFSFTEPLAGDVGSTTVKLGSYLRAVAKEHGSSNVVALAHNHFDSNQRFSGIGLDTTVAQIMPLYLRNSGGQTRLLDRDIIRRESRGARGANSVRSYSNANKGFAGECIYGC